MKAKKNNKGFTLVELIVVMAIMAILVGALAPQVVKYVEKARVSKDLQVENTLFTAVQTAIASSEVTVEDFSYASIAAMTTAKATADAAKTAGTASATQLALIAIYPEMISLLGTNMDSDAEILAACKSAQVTSTSAINIGYVKATGKITVSIGSLTPITNQ